MSAIVADWDPRVFESLSGVHTEDDFVSPLPIFISQNF
jgi:hypothetical protein